jgi:hypothetical protein
MSVHPGLSVEEVADQTPLDLIMPDQVPFTREPEWEELKNLRELDPTGIYLGKGQ